MTIEATLNDIAQSLRIIADHVRTSQTVTTVASVAAPVVATVAAPVVAPVAPAPVAAAPVAAAPAMPAPPTFDVPVFVPPAAAPAAPTMPFTDKAGLTRYVIDKYTKLGPQKGAEVGKIIQNLGFASVNEIPERSFKALFDALEKLS